MAQANSSGDRLSLAGLTLPPWIHGPPLGLSAIVGGVFEDRGHRGDMPFEETPRRPRGLRNGVVAGLGRLYGEGIAKGEVSLTSQRSAAQAP